MVSFATRFFTYTEKSGRPPASPELLPELLPELELLPLLLPELLLVPELLPELLPLMPELLPELPPASSLLLPPLLLEPQAPRAAPAATRSPTARVCALIMCIPLNRGSPSWAC